MLQNYFKTAIRFLLRNRSFSIINIFGLTAGFFSFMLIAFYIHDELSFDMFHRDAARIYRVLQVETKSDGNERIVAPVASRIGAESAQQIPGIESAIRVGMFGRLTMGNEPASRDYEQILVAEPHFFSFFDFNLLHGDPKTALSAPNSIVINQTIARKYFGTENVVGKTLWTNTKEMQVTGVMQDFPKNSHLQMDMVFSESTWENYFDWYKEFIASDWTSNSFITYIRTESKADVASIEKQMSELTGSNYPPDKEWKSVLQLQPLSAVHLNSGNIEGLIRGEIASKEFYIYMFGAVGILLLVIACLNFTNLSTASAFRRMKEIGTRKALGALKRQLIFQFTGEAIILTILSMCIAIVLIQLAIPVMNGITGKGITFTSLPITWYVVIASILFATAIISSLYPAFVITRIAPTEAIKKDIRAGGRSIPIRKVLVVAQFCITVLMITCTLVIHRQLNFLEAKELGFNVDNLVVADINSRTLRGKFESVKAAFAGIPEVQSVSVSSRVPGEWKNFPVASVRRDVSSDESEMIFVGIDQDFLNTYNIKLIAGRNFSSSLADSSKVIITRSAAKDLQLENPTGQVIEIPQVRSGGETEKFEQAFQAEVIGVCEDFHFESFRQKMMPLVFGYRSNPIQAIDYYTLRISTNDWPGTIEKLKNINSQFDVDNPLELTFLDERFEQFYAADVNRGRIFLFFSIVIVVIACLGLFALVSFSVEMRTKEMGIRKVLGASSNNIVMLISKEFLMLVVIATPLAVPVVYYFMNGWLQEFAYHITLHPGFFIVAGIIAIVIAFLTISIKTFKVAVANPVKSLRTE